MTLQNKISATFAALVLAGCGGSYNSSTAPVASTATPTIYTFSGTATAPTPSGTVATDAFNQINYIRSGLGLTQLNLSTLLTNAASSHISYIVLNNSFTSEGHGETVGNQGFSGATVADRVRFAGYASGFASEDMNSSTSPNGVSYASDLLAAPYRRQAILANFVDGGSAAGTQGSTYFYVIDFGGVNSNWGPTGNQLLVYPASGQTSVPTTWNGVDYPSVPGISAGQNVGFPISVQGAFNSTSTSTLTLSAMSLKDALGNAVAGSLVTTRSDALSGNLNNYGFFVPAAPLVSSQTYTATAAGTYNGVAFNFSWNFTTQ
jgi:hypothetical protein